MAFAPGCFFWPSFCRSLTCSQLCRISENARWGSPWQIWHSSAPRALCLGDPQRRGLQQNVVLGWHFKEMLVRTWWQGAPGCFFWPSFCRSLTWSQLCRISENARWGSPWQIWHSSAPRALLEARFAAKCVLGWHFKESLVMSTWWHWRQGVFSGLLFAGVWPGPNFAEFQKTRAGGPLGKFDIARLHGHF